MVPQVYCRPSGAWAGGVSATADDNAACFLSKSVRIQLLAITAKVIETDHQTVSAGEFGYSGNGVIPCRGPADSRKQMPSKCHIFNDRFQKTGVFSRFLEKDLNFQHKFVTITNRSGLPGGALKYPLFL